MVNIRSTNQGDPFPREYIDRPVIGRMEEAQCLSQRETPARKYQMTSPQPAHARRSAHLRTQFIRPNAGCIDHQLSPYLYVFFANFISQGYTLHTSCLVLTYFFYLNVIKSYSS